MSKPGSRSSRREKGEHFKEEEGVASKAPGRGRIWCPISGIQRSWTMAETYSLPPPSFPVEHRFLAMQVKRII